MLGRRYVHWLYNPSCHWIHLFSVYVDFIIKKFFSSGNVTLVCSLRQVGGASELTAPRRQVQGEGGVQGRDGEGRLKVTV